MPPGSIEIFRNPVIDTSVLFDFLVWRFCVETKTAFPGCISDSAAEKDTLRALHWYLDQVKPILTSPHVIAEIHGLVQSRAGWRGARLSDFWLIAQEELRRLSLDERSIKLVNMNSENLAAFGPTDDSILQIAVQKHGTVVTGDHGLRGRLKEKQIGILDRYEILALWQEHNA